MQLVINDIDLCHGSEGADADEDIASLNELAWVLGSALQPYGMHLADGKERGLANTLGGAQPLHQLVHRQAEVLVSADQDPSRESISQDFLAVL